MEKIKINSILLSEGSVNDTTGKKIIIGPLPDIGFKIVPNNFSFFVNFVLLNALPNTTYNLEVTMTESNGKIIVSSKIEGLSFNLKPGSLLNSFVSLGVNNQEFSCYGDCKVEVSIEQEDKNENNDKLSIVVPIVERK